MQGTKFANSEIQTLRLFSFWGGLSIAKWIYKKGPPLIFIPFLSRLLLSHPRAESPLPCPAFLPCTVATPSGASRCLTRTCRSSPLPKPHHGAAWCPSYPLLPEPPRMSHSPLPSSPDSREPPAPSQSRLVPGPATHRRRSLLGSVSHQHAGAAPSRHLQFPFA